jgi:hypothetical protein
MKNIFLQEVTQEVIDRIHKLTPDTQRQWGKMTVSQMLAHCSVTYEMIFEDIHPKPKGFQKFILKAFVKPIVTNEKPFKHNNPTAPAFLIKNDKDFQKEQKRLVDYIQRTQQLGPAHFEQKESHSFGKLSTNQWNNMFYKHLDHHLTQFGV